MKIKILWGFVGSGLLLGADSNKVKAGAIFDEVNDEYANTLIGKGLAVEVDANGRARAAKPKTNRAAAPNENKVLDSAGAAPSEVAAASDSDAADASTGGTSTEEGK